MQTINFDSRTGNDDARAHTYTHIRLHSVPAIKIEFFGRTRFCAADIVVVAVDVSTCCARSSALECAFFRRCRFKSAWMLQKSHATHINQTPPTIPAARILSALNANGLALYGATRVRLLFNKFFSLVLFRSATSYFTAFPMKIVICALFPLFFRLVFANNRYNTSAHTHLALLCRIQFGLRYSVSQSKTMQRKTVNEHIV